MTASLKFIIAIVTSRIVKSLLKIIAKGQYWTLTCITNHDTMFSMSAVNIRTNSNIKLT